MRSRATHPCRYSTTRIPLLLPAARGMASVTLLRVRILAEVTCGSENKYISTQYSTHVRPRALPLGVKVFPKNSKFEFPKMLVAHHQYLRGEHGRTLSLLERSSQKLDGRLTTVHIWC